MIDVGQSRQSGKSPTAAPRSSPIIFEPQLAGHLNVTRWLRVGLNVGYRFFAAPGELDGRDLGGIIGGFHAQLGWS